MERLTKYICDRAHGAEGVSDNCLTGAYCRGQFEATAIVERLSSIEDILGDDYDLDRLRELVEADRDGRCVVLPRKPHYRLYSGEEIYMIEDGEIYVDYVQEVILGEGFRDRNKVEALYNTGDDFSFCDRAWGKTVFLTREAAEAALKGEQDG